MSAAIRRIRRLHPRRYCARCLFGVSHPWRPRLDRDDGDRARPPVRVHGRLAPPPQEP